MDQLRNSANDMIDSLLASLQENIQNKESQALSSDVLASMNPSVADRICSVFTDASC